MKTALNFFINSPTRFTFFRFNTTNSTYLHAIINNPIYLTKSTKHLQHVLKFFDNHPHFHPVWERLLTVNRYRSGPGLVDQRLGESPHLLHLSQLTEAGNNPEIVQIWTRPFQKLFVSSKISTPSKLQFKMFLELFTFWAVRR